jgi:etoposide-induced 2.4 mRNA
VLLSAETNDKLECLLVRFIWIARGMSLARRVRYIEERWAYYFAFGTLPFTVAANTADDRSGLPSAALCTWGSGLANAALFALMCPAVRATHPTSLVCQYLPLYSTS